MALSVVILAAGQGTRMKSARPKVLQPLAGRPMLEHVLLTAARLDAASIHVVYGFGGDQVVDAFTTHDVNWVHQAQQLGTGHAVLQAMPGIADQDLVLVLCGDVPLVRAETLRPLVEAARQGAAVLTVIVDEPHGYGRIVRDADGRVARIVEQRDASPEECDIREVNTGLIAARAGDLKRWLSALEPDNAQGEYYLTDIVAMAVAEGVRVSAVQAGSGDEVRGINDRIQLAAAERLLCLRRAHELMRDGVTVVDPARLDVRGTVRCGRDVVIDVNVILEGEVVLDDGVRIGPNVHLTDVHLGAGTEVLDNTVIESSRTGSRCVLGPFARIRPGTELAEMVKVGNFVEIKKSRIDCGSKVNHLTYVGDSKIGESVNVGAGTITCNYDGANKHRTTIGDGAFIGSGVMLVAPVEIGAGATIGAGSVISRDAPANELTVARARQRRVTGWQRPKKDAAGK
jgi:bifunctional UDP-N-acetylglucosamine pyrophosphorylase/glucosamine-1-phosphate N-acetyltransferase